MTTAAELVVAAELDQLEEVARVEGWSIQRLTSLDFIVGLTAGDGTHLWVLCEAQGYRARPPRWRWCDENGDNIAGAKYRPSRNKGGSQFFHEDGVICAPWNSDAYKSENPGAPHGDWAIGNWLENSYTGQTRTLAAMASRIALELRLRFAGLVEQRQ